jgi:periplasmic protein CpxP/Spy
MLKNCLLALMLAGLVYAVAPSAIAQDNGANNQQPPQATAPMEHGHGHWDPQQRTEMLTKKLNLTSDQQAKVLDTLKSEQSQMESLRSDSSLSHQDRRTKMMDIHKATNDQIRGVLDENQQKKWDEMQAQHHERMQDHQNGQAPPAESQPQQPQL